MPAAAVIPAPIVSMVNAAVKRSVVLMSAICSVMPALLAGYGCMAGCAQRTGGTG